MSGSGYNHLQIDICEWFDEISTYVQRPRVFYRINYNSTGFQVQVGIFFSLVGLKHAQLCAYDGKKLPNYHKRGRLQPIGE